MKVGINGFGRIGRAVARIAESKPGIDITVINTRNTPTELMAHLLEYDSVYGKLGAEISHDEEAIYVDGRKIICTHHSDPGEIPWDHYSIDVVIDSTGAFKSREKLSPHLGGSVKKVILTCPEKDPSIPTIVLGTNESDIDLSSEDIVSNASCTTNCVSPIVKCLHDTIGIESCLFTTMHAYTNSQSLLDEKAKSLTMARGAPNNLIPTTTGAAKAVIKVVPDLTGKIDGTAIRVPISAGSLTDMTCNFSRATSKDEIDAIMRQASKGELSGILGFAEKPLVSCDYIGSPYSTIYDPFQTKQIGDQMFKIFAWYDNEWGYSVRVCELAQKLSSTF